MNIAVTHSRNDTVARTLAIEIAGELKLPYFERGRLSLEMLLTQNDLDYILVAEKERIVVRGPGSEFFWHPNMSVPRLKGLRSRQRDPFIEALGINEGSRILDCTLGMAADALVAAYAAGQSGHVTGLEASPIISFITRWGLDNFRGKHKAIHAAARRISVLNIPYEDFLREQPDNSFDVVYFDPMFRYSQHKSTGLNILRPFAIPNPVSAVNIKEALRVARTRVVMKESAESQEFVRLKAQKVTGGKYSPVSYGIWENK